MTPGTADISYKMLWVMEDAFALKSVLYSSQERSARASLERSSPVTLVRHQDLLCSTSETDRWNGRISALVDGDRRIEYELWAV